MSIYEKLLKIQTELKAPKSQYNSFGKYKYRNCEDIMEAVKPLCLNNKVVLTIGDSIVQIGDRYYVQATATLIDTESDGVINNTAYAREEAEKKGMDGSQVTGASSSYARKYALNGLFAIDDTKDSDATNEGDTPQKASQTPKKPAAKKEPLSKDFPVKEAKDRTVKEIIEEVQKASVNLDDRSRIAHITRALGFNDADMQKVSGMIKKHSGNGKIDGLTDPQYFALIDDIRVYAEGKRK